MPASFADAIQGWQRDPAFRATFNGLLAEVEFAAFRWETPAVAAATVTSPFEFVLLDSPGLARQPNPETFAEHFRRAPEASVIESPTSVTMRS
jgi:hypothetical protein